MPIHFIPFRRFKFLIPTVKCKFGFFFRSNHLLWERSKGWRTRVLNRPRHANTVTQLFSELSADTAVMMDTALRRYVLLPFRRVSGHVLLPSGSPTTRNPSQFWSRGAADLYGSSFTREVRQILSDLPRSLRSTCRTA